MIDFRLSKVKSPALSGLFLLVILTACQAPKSVDEITLLFWQSIADNDLATAKKYADLNSWSVLESDNEQKLTNATFSVGEIVINDTQARVETIASLSNNKTTSFTTFLVKEDQHWLVDYQRSKYSLSDDLFNGLFKSLKNIGDNLNKQMQQQMPLIEKQAESFGLELKKQLDKLGRDLEKALPPPQKKHDPYRDSI